jgi:hypothetical protein
MQVPQLLHDRSRRAQAQVLGFAIIFALAMTALTLYQVNVVPAKNEAVEFDHTESVATDMASLQDNLRSASATGAPTSTIVALGLRYPSRTLGINAPPPAGRIATGPTGTVVVENAVADGEAGDYWDGSARSFDTRSLPYSTAYNYRDLEPRFRLETGLLARQVDGATLVEASPGPVSGSRIDLLTLAGEYDATGQSRSLDLVPAGGAAESRLVTDDGDPITITVPTSLPTSAWRDALDDEPRVTNIAPAGSAVEITLQQGVDYRLRVPRAGIGSASDPPARYLAGGPTTRSVSANGRESITVTARDRFGNPVGGATVDATVLGDGSLDTEPETTDGEGQATFVYEPGPSGTDGTVVTEIGAGPARIVEFEMEVSDSGGGGGGGSGGTTDAGLGGRTDYQKRPNVTISQPEGLWKNVSTFDEVLLSNADFRFDDPTTQVRQVTLTFYAKDPDRMGNRKFRISMKPANDDSTWQTKKVKISDTFSSTTYVNDAKLTQRAANKIFDRNGRSGRVDLLDNEAYTTNPLSAPEENEIQNVASDDTYLYTQTVTGGIVEVTIEEPDDQPPGAVGGTADDGG